MTPSNELRLGPCGGAKASRSRCCGLWRPPPAAGFLSSRPSRRRRSPAVKTPEHGSTTPRQQRRGNPSPEPTPLRSPHSVGRLSGSAWRRRRRRRSRSARRSRWRCSTAWPRSPTTATGASPSSTPSATASHRRCCSSRFLPFPERIVLFSIFF